MRVEAETQTFFNINFSFSGSRNVVFTIVSQSEPYHASVAKRLKQDLENQVYQLEEVMIFFCNILSGQQTLECVDRNKKNTRKSVLLIQQWEVY